MAFQSIIELVARALEGMGIAVVAAGGLGAMATFARRLGTGDAFEAGGSDIRERLARATLLGLEFLVAADIIATVASVPTPTNLLMLTGIVLLRTFLSATLMLEVEGRWPWNAAGRDTRSLPFMPPARDASPARLSTADSQNL